MILFIAPSFDKNLFSCLYDNETVSRCSKSLPTPLAGYKSGILACYDYRISSGPLEGTNNKIKTMKRMAYGFRDMEFFKLIIMALHETKYALVG